MAIVSGSRKIAPVCGDECRTGCHYFPVLFVGIIAAFQGLGAGVPSCIGPDDWTFYPQYNNCLKAFTSPKTYETARNVCMSHNGTLAQMWDEDAMLLVMNASFTPPIPGIGFGEHNAGMVINPRMSLSDGVEYWIGISDLDADGTFEYANGSKLLSDQPLHAQQEGLPYCMSLHTTLGVQSARCDLNFSAICQRPFTLNEENDSTACTLDECVCNRDDWFYFEAATKYIKINNVATDYVGAQGLCQKLNGQLLTLRDRGTGKFIESLDYVWRPTAIFYWLGLRGLGDGWYWVDGTMEHLGDGGHKWFYLPAVNDTNCAAVIWDYDQKLRPTDCRGAYFHICEATEPCSRKIVMSIDNEIILSHVNNKTFMYGHVMEIKCFVVGYATDTNHVTSYCGGSKHQANKWGANKVPSVSHIIRIEESIHETQCHCEATYDDGGWVKDVSYNVTILVLASPRLVDSTVTTLNYTYTFGKVANAEFAIIANPRPHAINLSRYRQESKLKYKSTRFTTFEGPVYGLSRQTFEYIVYVASVTVFARQDVGIYHVDIDNGIGDVLIVVLDFQEEEDSDRLWTFLVVALVIFGVCCTLTLIGAYCLCGHSQQEKEHASTFVETEGDSYSSSSYSDDSDDVSDYSDDEESSSSFTLFSTTTDGTIAVSEKKSRVVPDYWKFARDSNVDFGFDSSVDSHYLNTDFEEIARSVWGPSASKMSTAVITDGKSTKSGRSVIPPSGGRHNAYLAPLSKRSYRNIPALDTHSTSDAISIGRLDSDSDEYDDGRYQANLPSPNVSAKSQIVDTRGGTAKFQISDSSGLRGKSQISDSSGLRGKSQISDSSGLRGKSQIASRVLRGKSQAVNSRGVSGKSEVFDSPDSDSSEKSPSRKPRYDGKKSHF